MVRLALTGIVLVCFIIAVTLHFLDKMKPAIFKAIRVFTCIIGIVVLAKAMFYA